LGIEIRIVSDTGPLIHLSESEIVYLNYIPEKIEDEFVSVGELELIKTKLIQLNYSEDSKP